MRYVKNVPLQTHRDMRGQLTEIFRADWLDAPSPVQWNVLQSGVNVLRGMKVHVTHTDFLVVLQGRLLVGTRDLRKPAGEEIAGSIVELSADNPSLLMIPPGVAHGFYSPEPSLFLVGVSSYWDAVNDEFRCRWDDPELRIPWPSAMSPALSSLDECACSLADLLALLRSGGRVSW